MQLQCNERVEADSEQLVIGETQLKKGYKKTEIGGIPNDWEIKLLKEVSTIISDGIHSTPQYVNYGDFFFINGNNLINGIIEITHRTMHIDKNQYQKYKKDLNNQTILLSINGTIGSVAIYNNENVVLGKSVAYINLNYFANKFYMFYLLQSHLITSRFENELTGTTIKNLSLKTIKNTLIPLPSLEEQKNIAEALSNADALISALDVLITKKRNIKQGAMQQLLTGKRRLQGYEDEWKYNRLGDIAEIDSDNLKSDTNLNYTFKYISLEDIETGILKNVTEYSFQNAPSRARRKLKRNDMLVATVRPNLKSHYYIKDDVQDLICSTGFSVIRCDEKSLCSKYIYQLFFGDKIANQFNALLVGSNYPAINSSDIKNLLIPLPDRSEQQAIAEILCDMDTEIEQLEQQRDKTKLIKQGMMQELLTGKTRLCYEQSGRSRENNAELDSAVIANELRVHVSR